LNSDFNQSASTNNELPLRSWTVAIRQISLALVEIPGTLAFRLQGSLEHDGGLGPADEALEDLPLCGDRLQRVAQAMLQRGAPDHARK